MTTKKKTNYQKRKEKELPHNAFDIIFDKDTKKYILVEIGYNLDTKYARVLKQVAIADNLHLAMYKAKELLINKLMLKRSE